MGNSISAFAPNCRVFILVDDVKQVDYNLNPQKSFYKLNSIVSVSSTISVDDGSATVILNDKDMKFSKYYPFKYLNTRTFGDEKIETSDPKIAESDLDREPLPIALTNGQEIEAYRKLLKLYGEKSSALEVMYNLAKGQSSLGDEPEHYGGVLAPLFTPQNLIWIDYLGRDGYWYRKFSGIISKIDDSEETKRTSQMTLRCSTYKSMLKYSQVVVGTNNIGGLKSTEIASVINQKQTLTSNNKYYGKTFNEIIVDVFKTTNNFFIRDRQVKGKDYRYYKVKDVFGFDGFEDEEIKEKIINNKEFLELQTFGTNEVSDEVKQRLTGDWTYDRITGTYYLEDGTFVYNDKGKTDKEVNDISNKQKYENGYPITSKVFQTKKFKYDEPIDIYKDFYPGSEVIRDNKQVSSKEGRAWIQVLMCDDFFGDKKPFQNLVRTSLTLFNTEKQTPEDILNEIKNIVLCYIYFDGDGTVKIERPYFDIDMSFLFLADIGLDAQYPPDFDLKYVITKKDRSYLARNSSENESQIVTRVTLQANPDFVNFDSITGEILQGYSNSSLKTIAKYGERFVTLKPIVSQKFRSSSQAEDILNSYCYAQKLLLTSGSKTQDFVLDQRPDLQLNRPLLYLDKGVVTLITSLTETFNFAKNTHRTTVQGKYTRFVGEQLINPWRKKIVRDDELSSGWSLEDWKDIEPVDLSISKNILGIGNNDLKDIGFFDDTETYDKIKTYLQTAINNLKPSFSIEEDKYTCLILRHGKDNVNGFDSKKGDIIYFIWKENGVGKYIKFFGCGGDPQTNESRWSKSSYFEYSKLENGIYRYANPDESSYLDNKNKFLKFSCDDFKFTKVRKDNNGNFINGTESFDSKSIKNVTDINGNNKKLVSFLSSASTVLYNTSDGIEGNDKKICYDSLSIGVSGSDSNNFLKSIVNNQTYIDVVIYMFSGNKEENPNSVIGETNTDLQPTDIRNIFLYIYSINIGNINKNNNVGITFKESPKFVDIQSNSSFGNKRRGIYLVTQEFTGISDDKEWIKFLNSSSIQDAWMDEYTTYIKQVVNNTTYVINNLSIKERIDILLGNNSNFLSVNTSKSGQVTPIYDTPTNSNVRVNDFPVDSVINSLSAIYGLIHLGFTEAMLKNPTLSYQSLYENKLDIITKYISDYYLFNIWNLSDITPTISDNFKNSDWLNFQKLKNIEIDKDTLKGRIKVWEFVKLLQRITI